jgi:hypothetical protein
VWPCEEGSTPIYLPQADLSTAGRQTNLAKILLQFLPLVILREYIIYAQPAYRFTNRNYV